MRWTALAALCVGGCLGSNTVPCPGQDFTCPADLACAAPGYCGPPAQVEKCDGLCEWDACVFHDEPETAGSCRRGICELCTPDREGCTTTSTWYAMSLPADTNIRSLWVNGRADAFAVGDAGVLLHYDGTEWQSVETTPPVPTSVELHSIWGSSSSDYYIVTSGGDESNLLHVRNGALTREGMPSSLLKAIWGTAADNVFGVGLTGTIIHFDGVTWTSMTSGIAQTLTAIHGSATQVIAITTFGAFTRFDGVKWTAGTIPINPTTQSLNGLWVGDNEAFVVGENRTLLRFDGASWSPVDIDISVPALGLYGVWGSGSDYYAVAADGVVLRSIDGRSWGPVNPTPGSSPLRAVSGSSDKDVFIVGLLGTIWHYTEYLRGTCR